MATDQKVPVCPTGARVLHRLARCYERRTTVVNAFFDLADTIITVRSLIRRGWPTYRRHKRRTTAEKHTPSVRALGARIPLVFTEAG